MGNSHGKGFPCVWTPSKYVSTNQGSHVMRWVQTMGVANDTASADDADKAANLGHDVARLHTIPISISDTPMQFSTSMRNRSVHGAQCQAMKYSCRRNSMAR